MAIDSTIRSPRDGFPLNGVAKLLSVFSFIPRIHTAFPLNSLGSVGEFRLFSPSLSLSLCQSTGRREPSDRYVRQWDGGWLPRASGVLYKRVTIVLGGRSRDGENKEGEYLHGDAISAWVTMNPAYGEARKISDERLCPRLFYYPRVGLTVPTSLDPRAYLPRILDHSQKYGTASRNKLEVVPRVSASRSFYVLVKRAVFTRL